MTKQCLSIYGVFLILGIFSLSFPCPIHAVEKSAATTIKASIAYKTTLKLFGYTAPNAIVLAEATRVFAQVPSDKKGYFEINDLPISEQVKEICITTIDSLRRTGFPLCIPIPFDESTREIGPILLSPTISLSNSTIWQYEKTIIDGYTIPDTDITISFFTQANSSLVENISNSIATIISPEVYAASFPLITGKSDKKGNFSINLPTSKSKTYRVFAKAIYQNLPSMKSQTLSFHIGSQLDYFARFILPKIVLVLCVIGIMVILSYLEYKTGVMKKWSKEFNDKKWKPFGVKLHLLFRRLLYNLQGYWK